MSLHLLLYDLIKNPSNNKRLLSLRLSYKLLPLGTAIVKTFRSIYYGSLRILPCQDLSKLNIETFDVDESLYMKSIKQAVYIKGIEKHICFK